jgi:hypothetical protein
MNNKLFNDINKILEKPSTSRLRNGDLNTIEHFMRMRNDNKYTSIFIDDESKVLLVDEPSGPSYYKSESLDQIKAKKVLNSLGKEFITLRSTTTYRNLISNYTDNIYYHLMTELYEFFDLYCTNKKFCNNRNVVVYKNFIKLYNKYKNFMNINYCGTVSAESQDFTFRIPIVAYNCKGKRALFLMQYTIVMSPTGIGVITKLLTNELYTEHYIIRAFERFPNINNIIDAIDNHKSQIKSEQPLDTYSLTIENMAKILNETNIILKLILDINDEADDDGSVCGINITYFNNEITTIGYQKSIVKVDTSLYQFKLNSSRDFYNIQDDMFSVIEMFMYPTVLPTDFSVFIPEKYKDLASLVFKFNIFAYEITESATASRNSKSIEELNNCNADICAKFFPEFNFKAEDNILQFIINTFIENGTLDQEDLDSKNYKKIFRLVYINKIFLTIKYIESVYSKSDITQIKKEIEPTTSYYGRRHKGKSDEYYGTSRQP